MEDVASRVRIALRPSRTLLLALATAYAGAAVCLLSLDLGFGIKSLLLAFLTLSAVCDLYLHAGVRSRQVSEIILNSDGDWRLISPSGEVLRGRPVPGRLVHALAICFSIRLDGTKRLPVLVLGDMCSGDAFRQLRAWLRAHGEDVADKRYRSGDVFDRGQGGERRS